MTEEIWRTMVGFEDYEASNLGRVRSLKYGKTRVLNTYTHPRGPQVFTPCINGVVGSMSTARAVALAFLQLPDREFEVRNRGPKDEVRPENLTLFSLDGTLIETKLKK